MTPPTTRADVMARTLSREEAIKAAENAAPCDNPSPARQLTDDDYRAIARTQKLRAEGRDVLILCPGSVWEYRHHFGSAKEALMYAETENGRAAVAEYERRAAMRAAGE